MSHLIHFLGSPTFLVAPTTEAHTTVQTTAKETVKPTDRAATKSSTTKADETSTDAGREKVIKLVFIIILALNY